MLENGGNWPGAFVDFAAEGGLTKKPNKSIFRQKYLTKVVWKSVKLHAIFIALA
jgi:hypothetical protein